MHSARRAGYREAELQRGRGNNCLCLRCSRICNRVELRKFAILRLVKRGTKVCGQWGEGEGSPSAHTARHSPWASIRCVCVINVLNVGVACLGLPAAASRRKCVRCPSPFPIPLQPRALFMRFGLRLCRALMQRRGEQGEEGNHCWPDQLQLKI